MKNTMDNRTKIVFAVFLLSVLLVTFSVYSKYFLDREYPIFAEVPCDPVAEVCFVYHCDFETDECTGAVEEDTSYYKKVERKAASFPLCDPNDETCVVTSCATDEVECAVTLCDPADGEVECSSPEDFQTIVEESNSEESVETEEESELSSVAESESQTDLEE